MRAVIACTPCIGHKARRSDFPSDFFLDGRRVPHHVPRRTPPRRDRSGNPGTPRHLRLFAPPDLLNVLNSGKAFFRGFYEAQKPDVVTHGSFCNSLLQNWLLRPSLGSGFQIAGVTGRERHAGGGKLPSGCAEVASRVVAFTQPAWVEEQAGRGRDGRSDIAPDYRKPELINML
jgi:hypothetical protein